MIAAFQCVFFVSSDKRKTSAITRLSDVVTDVETSFGGKEIKRLSVLEKLDYH